MPLDFQGINMSARDCLCSFLQQLGVMSHTTRNNQASDSSTPSATTTSETHCESDFEELLKQIGELGDYDHHDILRRTNKKGWCAWHLNVKANVDAVKIAQAFHENKAKLKLTSSFKDTVDTIEEMVSKLKLKVKEKNYIQNCLAQVQREGNLLPIITIYTRYQQFSKRLNSYLALNTYHTLNFYCTLLNCPALAQTEESTETFTNILFHPQFEKYIVRKKTVYRGFPLEDKKFIENYKKGATIITTTVLSTSEDPNVANVFSGDPSHGQITVFCIYNINNTKRRTALNVQEISCHPDEMEILILPYIPFVIESVNQMDNGHRIEFSLNECEEGLESI